MNQEDVAAEPMYDAFTAHPNYAPYNVQPNQIPLTLGAPGYPSTLTYRGRPDAGDADAGVPTCRAWCPADMRGGLRRLGAVAKQPGAATADGTAPPREAGAAQPARLVLGAQLEGRLSGRSEDLPPDQVPGRNLPAAFIGDN